MAVKIPRTSVLGRDYVNPQSEIMADVANHMRLPRHEALVRATGTVVFQDDRRHKCCIVMDMCGEPVSRYCFSDE